MKIVFDKNKKAKTFVLDTNILLHSPNAIYGFDDNEVVITSTTLQELDKFKSYHDEKGFNARESCRILEELRTKGNLTEGVKLDNGGILKIEPNGVDESNLPQGYSISVPDNRIISTALSLKKKSDIGTSVILVTNDVSMRINASICGLDVESYRNDHISADDTYTGRREMIVGSNIINDMYKQGFVDANYILREYCTPDFCENEYVILKSNQNSVLGQYKNGVIHRVKEVSNVFGVNPRNAAQNFFLSALLAPTDEIPLVIGIGPAGCAKTYLSLAAGLDAQYSNQYDRILISRNNVTADADFGYLPGDLDDKMTPLLAPFLDNLESLLRGNTKEDRDQIQMQIEDMFLTKVLDICPLAYMRGRSITNSYLIVDEAQNATKSQIRDIITRAGQGTKVVLLGDPNQIDNHLLDRWNNGLVWAAEKMKNSPLCAQVTFNEHESVRSKLATEAIKCLS